MVQDSPEFTLEPLEIQHTLESITDPKELHQASGSELAYKDFKSKMEEAIKKQSEHMAAFAETPYGKFLDILGTGLNLIAPGRAPIVPKPTIRPTGPKTTTKVTGSPETPQPANANEKITPEALDNIKSTPEGQIPDSGFDFTADLQKQPFVEGYRDKLDPYEKAVDTQTARNKLTPIEGGKPVPDSHFRMTPAEVKYFNKAMEKYGLKDEVPSVQIDGTTLRFDAKDFQKLWDHIDTTKATKDKGERLPPSFNNIKALLKRSNLVDEPTKPLKAAEDLDTSSWNKLMPQLIAMSKNFDDSNFPVSTNIEDRQKEDLSKPGTPEYDRDTKAFLKRIIQPLPPEITEPEAHNIAYQAGYYDIPIKNNPSFLKYQGKHKKPL